MKQKTNKAAIKRDLSGRVLSNSATPGTRTHRLEHELYTNRLRTVENLVKWHTTYMLYNFTSHRLHPLPVSSKTEQLIRERNLLTKQLKDSLKEDLAAFKESISEEEARTLEKIKP